MPEHGHAPRPSNPGFDSTGAVARLNVEAELTAGLEAEAIQDCVDALPADRPAALVLDLGSGPGLGSVALAQALPGATVLAVDSAESMLDEVIARARTAGLEPRVGVQRLDLERGDLEGAPCDLIWASMTVHHVSTPGELLARVASRLRPDGVLCLLEHAEAPVVRLAGDLGRPGLWERLQEVRAGVPHGGRSGVAELPAMVASAGLEVIVDRTLTAHHTDAGRSAVRRYAHSQLSGVATHLGDRLEPGDLEALRTFARSTDPEDAYGWDGVEVALSRRLLVARRPG